MIFRQNREYKQVGHLSMGIEDDGQGNLVHTATEVFACPDCGALVWDVEKHDRSHVSTTIGLGL